MTTSADYPNSLAPLTELLTTHAELIIETSDTMATELSEGITDLRQKLTEVVDLPDVGPDFVRLLGALQAQDILRQQVFVLIKGMEAVAKASIPADQEPQQWYMDRLKEIEAGYVMQAQHQIHADFLGVERETDEQDAMFF